jgi:hypothetical protein
LRLSDGLFAFRTFDLWTFRPQTGLPANSASAR